MKVWTMMPVMKERPRGRTIWKQMCRKEMSGISPDAKEHSDTVSTLFCVLTNKIVKAILVLLAIPTLHRNQGKLRPTAPC